MSSKRRVMAEWEPQQCVEIAWPDEQTDWAPTLAEAVACYRDIVRQIVRHEELLIVAHDRQRVEKDLQGIDLEKVTIIEAQYNDTWVRDYGFISVCDGGQVKLLDFKFNGWGLKYAANYDNLVNIKLFDEYFKQRGYKYESHLDTVLEGGSIESDGGATLLTTHSCLRTINRNGTTDYRQLHDMFGALLKPGRFLWLEGGTLAGDDTDGHIDQIVRLEPSQRKALIVSTEDTSDEHYATLRRLSKSLSECAAPTQANYEQVRLPLPDAVRDPETGERLPASYANYLIINGAVLVPIYGVRQDDEALKIIGSVFPERETVGINCRALVRQRGSLHCATMQYPIAKHCSTEI